jgi:L-alanine-DL-glutamate epimerase-like enolase superfamily enzyme
VGRVSDFERLSGLPIRIEGYELVGQDREYGNFTRGSTVVRIRGDGQEGIGEDVVYEVLDHVANRDLGPRFDLTGPTTLGELCELTGELDLFEGAPPEREDSRLYRRWAYESAALDLALRQNGTSLHEAVGRDPKPVHFVCSTRLTAFDDDSVSSTEALRARLDRYPGLEFKLDPENDWTPELIEKIRGLAPVRVLDLKGLYRGTPVDVETDPELYRAVAEAFPEAYLEDPDLEPPEARAALEPHRARITWDAPLHSVADIVERAPERAINSKPSRFGSLEELLAVYEHCEGEGLAIYGGGQGEVEAGPGRGQIQYLASLYHPDTPNDTAPSGYNDPSVPEGLPTSPMDPVPSETGFRWGGD